MADHAIHFFSNSWPQRRLASRMLVMAISCYRNHFPQSVAPNPLGTWRTLWEPLASFVLIRNSRGSPLSSLSIIWRKIRCLRCGRSIPNIGTPGADAMSACRSLSSECVLRWFPDSSWDQWSSVLANAVVFSLGLSSGSWALQDSPLPFAAGSSFRLSLLSPFGGLPHPPCNLLCRNASILLRKESFRA